MFTQHLLCPITGLEVVYHEKHDENFRGLQYVIPSISEKLLVSISDSVLQNNELRNALIEHREKFVNNLKMISKLRHETFVSSGNWWLFLK